MYGKIFATMYDGTLGENWKGLVTFQQLIVLCDSQGIVDITPNNIARRTGIPIEIISEGLTYLQSPDINSRTPGDDGRRIDLIDEHRTWGWRIVNFKKYQMLSSWEDKKASDRERIAKKRSNKSSVSRSVANGREQSRAVADVAHTDTDTDTITTYVEQARPADLIFDFWKAELNHPRASLDKTRRKAIQGRLDEGKSVERIQNAIRGLKLCPHNMGDNERKQKYDDIELICRNGKNVDRFADIWEEHAEKHRAKMRAEEEYQRRYTQSRTPADVTPATEEEIRKAEEARAELKKKWGMR